MKKSKIISLLLTTALASTAAASSAVVAGATTTPSSVMTVSGVVTNMEGQYPGYTFDSKTDTLSYREDLAYVWHDTKEANYFNMQFALSGSYETMVLTFESQEYNTTAKKKATNTLTFSKTGVKANDGEEVAVSTLEDGVSVDFVSFAEGKYTVAVNDVTIGQFSNVRGYWAEYVSGSSGVVPIKMAFTGDELNATLTMQQLNNQSFELENGSFKTNADPVFVLNNEVKSFTLGYEIKLDYEVIDVLGDKVTATVEYSQWNKKENKAGEYTKLSEPVFDLEGTDSKEEYIKLQCTLSTSTPKVIDIAWYADSSDLKTSCVYNGTLQEMDGEYFIVNRDLSSPHYVYEDPSTDEYKNMVEGYQGAVTEAAKDLAAGSGRYFYLPSLSTLIDDNDTGYTSLNFTIFYKTPTSSSVSSLTKSSTNLSISVSEPGLYSFKVIASDRLGNGMTYTEEIDGIERKVAITSSNVYNDECDFIPEFTFYAINNGVEITKSEKVDVSYLETTYSFSSMEVKGISGYASNRNLYRFDTEKYIADGNDASNLYSVLLTPDDLFKSSPEYFVEITVYDSQVEKDDNEYHFTSSSSSSFIPVETGFYVLRTEVIDKYVNSYRDVAYQTVNIQAAKDVVVGETYWVQNNIISIVALSVAALSFIGIIVVLVIKPKSEEDLMEIDVPKKKSKKN